MKFLKYSAFVLFGLILFTSISGSDDASTLNQNNISEEIVQLETAINNGQVITDGMIENIKNPDAKPNAIGEGAVEVGVKVSSGFASIMEMVSDFFEALLG